MLLEREVRTPTADEAVCRRYYDSHRARFRTPDLFEPAHILFKARRDDAVAYAKAVAQAEAVLAELAERPDRFDDSRAEPVRLPFGDGWRAARTGRARRDDAEFETFLSATGARPDLPDAGAHPLRRACAAAGPQGRGRRRCRSRRSAIGSPRIWKKRTWRRAVAQYVALLAGQARITGFDLPAATSPLVQ